MLKPRDTCAGRGGERRAEQVKSVQKNESIERAYRDGGSAPARITQHQHLLGLAGALQAFQGLEPSLERSCLLCYLG